MGQVEGCGCGLLLGLLALALLLPLLPYLFGLLLVTLLLALVLSLPSRWIEEQRRQQLRAIAAAGQDRFGGDVCRLGDRYGVLEAVHPAPAPSRSTQPHRLALHIRLLQPGEEQPLDADLPLQAVQEVLQLAVPPGQLGTLASTGALGRFLEGQGIARVSDLAVEARATRAALQCARERDWARGALDRLQDLLASLRGTLAKAEGNALLEPSIPQLRQALDAFEGEGGRLRRLARESDAMLRQLHDFLSVPQEIRPILNFDLDGLVDPARLEDLQASFEDVVSLNEAYRALSRDRLA